MERGGRFGLRAVTGFALVVALSCLSCGSSESPGPASASQPANPCKDTAAIKASTAEFLDAFNAGDLERLKATIASKKRFRVYSERLSYRRHGGPFFATRQRPKLLRHLVHRQAKGDRMWLKGKLQVGDYDPDFQLCGIGSDTLWRWIAGGPKKPFYFKAALDARSGRVAVWNIGGPV